MLHLAAAFILATVLILAVEGWFWLKISRRLRVTAQSAHTLADQLQKRIEELEASRSQMEGILQGMVEGVLAIGPQGETLLVNAAAGEIFGVAPDLPKGTPAKELIRQPELQQLLHQTLTTAHSEIRDITLYAPSERTLRVHATACKTPLGRGALMVFHDITDLKRLENLRRDFVANVSHELKTPLTAIQGAVETLLEGALADPSNARPFVESIAEETLRLRRLVEDLLTLAQVESKQATLKSEAIMIPSFLEAEIARHQALAAAHQVSLRLDSPGSIAPLRADRSELAQAISNLLDNAIKYNRPGGRVLVRAREADNQLQIEIEDTGIGIPASDLPRIFERFYRVDKARSRETGGTGLGLSIVKHVAEAHGGRVSVESEPGKGSCFTLVFPLA